MPLPLKPSFPHRRKVDGSHDAICTMCLATVATVQRESELTYYESVHVCEPTSLYRVSHGLLPLRKIALQLSSNANGHQHSNAVLDHYSGGAGVGRLRSDQWRSNLKFTGPICFSIIR